MTDLDELQQNVHPGAFRQRLKHNIVNGRNMTSFISITAGSLSLDPLSIVSRFHQMLGPYMRHATTLTPTNTPNQNYQNTEGNSVYCENVATEQKKSTTTSNSIYWLLFQMNLGQPVTI